MKIRILTFLACLACFGCIKGPDENEQWHVICYSGDRVIYEGDAAHGITTSSQVNFIEKESGKTVRITNSCVIRVVPKTGAKTEPPRIR